MITIMITATTITTVTSTTKAHFSGARGAGADMDRDGIKALLFS
jgi:hypothetical protein